MTLYLVLNVNVRQDAMGPIVITVTQIVIHIMTYTLVKTVVHATIVIHCRAELMIWVLTALVSRVLLANCVKLV